MNFADGTVFSIWKLVFFAYGAEAALETKPRAYLSVLYACSFCIFLPSRAEKL
jgi:hypothetical protein